MRQLNWVVAGTQWQEQCTSYHRSYHTQGSLLLCSPPLGLWAYGPTRGESGSLTHRRYAALTYEPHKVWGPKGSPLSWCGTPTLIATRNRRLKGSIHHGIHIVLHAVIKNMVGRNKDMAGRVFEPNNSYIQSHRERHYHA